MDVLQAARELGKAIQADERFTRIMIAQDKNDEDTSLQDEIGAFNLKRTQLNAELQNPNKDQDKIKEMDTELKALYAKVFENPNMAEFAAAKTEMDAMLGAINKIISGSAGGMDPDTIDTEPSSCGGECGGCSGCH